MVYGAIGVISVNVIQRVEEESNIETGVVIIRIRNMVVICVFSWIIIQRDEMRLIHKDVVIIHVHVSVFISFNFFTFSTRYLCNLRSISYRRDRQASQMTVYDFMFACMFLSFIYTAKISHFVDIPLEKIVNEIKSHIKDTTDFINKIETITDLPENTIIVTMDVKSLFTNIPNREGINAVAKALENQTDLKIPTFNTHSEQF